MDGNSDILKKLITSFLFPASGTIRVSSSMEGQLAGKEELMSQLNTSLHRMMMLNHAIRQTQRNRLMGAIDFLIRVRDVRSPCSDLFQPRLIEQLNSVLTECAERCSRLILEQQLCARLEVEAEIKRTYRALLSIGVPDKELHAITSRVMSGHRNWHTECLAFGVFREPVNFYVGPVNNPNGIRANRGPALHTPRPMQYPN